MNNYEIMMNGIVTIGEYAPEFEATTTMGNVKLSDYKGKWLVLFSHPRRFYPSLYNRNYSFYSEHIHILKI